MKKSENMFTRMSVKAAAVQISPVLYNRQSTIEKIVKKICELGKQGVQVSSSRPFLKLLFPTTPISPLCNPRLQWGRNISDCLKSQSQFRLPR